MSFTLSEEKTKLINSIAESEGFNDFGLKITSGSMKGDGYLGIINTIDIQEKSNNEKKLHLIIKSAQSEVKLRELSPIHKAYERESYLYQTVFPEYNKFSQELQIKNRFRETAKCYGCLLQDNEECIVLENLKEKYFKLWDRKKPMNEEHVRLGFQTYGKLHATGIALKLLKPELYETLRKNLVNIFQKDEETEEDRKQFEDSFKTILGNGLRAVAGNEKATKALMNFAQTIGSFFKEDLKKTDKYETILHGDCWCNNMMFKYDDLTDLCKPTNMCLLDWQIAHTGSPILDLSYFFYASTSKEILNNFENFLKIYYDSFSVTLREAGLDAVLTFDELENEWKKFSKYGLFMTMFVMKVILSESEEAPDLSELAKSGKNILESISASESVNNEAINKRLHDLIVFMVDNNFI